jgi:hypothetical protein
MSMIVLVDTVAALRQDKLAGGGDAPTPVK